jgi:hypothetical protein
MRIVLTEDAFRHLNLAGVVSRDGLEPSLPAFGGPVPQVPRPGELASLVGVEPTPFTFVA